MRCRGAHGHDRRRYDGLLHLSGALARKPHDGGLDPRREPARNSHAPQHAHDHLNGQSGGRGGGHGDDDRHLILAHRSIQQSVLWVLELLAIKLTALQVLVLYGNLTYSRGDMIPR